MRAYERLLNYVRVHTTSDENSGTHPSAEREFDLARQLVDEMKALGMEDAHVDEHCYVYGTLPATPGCEDQHALGLIAHMDTADDASGENVQPVVWENYNGGDVTLPATGMVMKPSVFPFLTSMKGETLITSDGTTLLGADDKAGIAEIMTMAEYFMAHPEIPHGTIKIAFTPDEEVGHGVDFFDVPGWGADVAYTVDGGAFGEMEYETFNAASMSVTIHGQNIHPGSAKGKMKNAILIGLEFQSMLPEAEKPQYTEMYEGFYHLNGISGNVEETVLKYIVRDHDKEIFESRKAMGHTIADFLNKKYGEGTVVVETSDTYYNMAEKIRPHMYLMDIAAEAFKELGVDTPNVRPVRGGTDGSRLSYMGLPCPNLCTGDHNAHGKYEFVCIQSMEQTVELLIKIAEKFKDVKKA